MMLYFIYSSTKNRKAKMNNFISQINFFKRKRKFIDDPFKNHSEILLLPSQRKIKILYRQNQPNSLKYCMTSIISNSILYTFLKITSTQYDFQPNHHSLHLTIQICLDTFDHHTKILISNLNKVTLDRILKSVSTFSDQTFICYSKNIETHSNRICFKFLINNSFNNVILLAIESCFHVFYFLIDRLNSYTKLLLERQKVSNLEIQNFRSSLTSIIFIKDKDNANNINDSFIYFKNQEEKYHKSMQIYFLQSRFQYQNSINFSFEENVEKRKKLEQILQKKHNEIIKQHKKQKVCTNINIEKIEELNYFCIKTKFSIIRPCFLQFKVIGTHINGRSGFQKNQQNLNYLDRMVEMSNNYKKQLARKKPNIDLQSQNGEIPIQPLSSNPTNSGRIDPLKISKSKRILKNQKNCLKIMKQLEAMNICSYYVNYEEEDSLYSKILNCSLDQWIENQSKYNDRTLLEIFLQILNGLEEMSFYNIIHRDLKPDNILIDLSCPIDPIVKLIDFGSTIYAYSNSPTYEMEVEQNFDPTLRTTKYYNMNFRLFKQFNKINSIIERKQSYNEVTYNRHVNFDVYSVGKILEEFKGKFQNYRLIDNLEFLIKICTNPDPHYRLNIQEITLFLTTLKNFYCIQL